MKIAINLVTILPGQIGGIETYTNKTIEWLKKIDQQNEYVLFTNTANHQFYSKYISERISTYQVKGRAESRFKRLLSIYFYLPLLCKKKSIDILFSPGNIAPLWLPCKSVLTLHDAVYQNKKSSLDEKLQRLIYSISAFRANLIITVSNSAAKDIIKYCYVKKEKIIVTKQGGNIDPNKIATPDEIKDLKDKYQTNKYLLSLGSLIHRKNYPVLIEAFSHLEDKDIKLIIVGCSGPATEKIKKTIQIFKLTDRVIITGYFKGSLETLYQGAEIYIQPSSYEGFGIPVLEAMSLGTPVISSNSSSLPEVGGNAVLYFDPVNTSQLTQQINRVLNTPTLKNDLIKKGIEQSKLFSWEKNAQTHKQVFNQLSLKTYLK
jgi:glycosyltransferase involved in cell wall biosynthesis